MLQNGIIRYPEMIIKPKIGRERFIVASGARLYDEEKNVSGAVIALHNITDWKEAEEKLRISEETFRGSFESAADGMAITDASGTCIEVNDRLCEIMGYSASELKTLNFQEVTYPEDLEEDLRLWTKLLEGERDYYQMEKRAVHKSGEIKHILVSVAIVRDENNDPFHFITQITDISDLKEAHSKLNSFFEITKEQNQRLNNFAHIVSHNLRSHSGNIEMLLNIYSEDHPESKEDEIIQMALTASQNLKDTIKDLNEVAFLETSVSQKLIPINLRNSVGNTLNSINAIIKNSNIQVFNNIPKELEVLSVPAYLDSIILNFATNAIKYRSSERQPILRFEAVKREEYIKLSIEDNGLGIDLQKHGEKLFGLYKTFHQNEDAKGIGLFITKNQIEATGGKLEVESEVNKGTIFTIYFKNGKE